MDEIIRIKLGFTNTFLLRVSDEYILIDVGTSKKTKKFLRILDDYNISPDKINYIVITHAHFDHTGCLAEIQKITGAQVIAHKNAVDLLKQGKNAFVGIKIKRFNSLIRRKLDKPQVYHPVTPDIIVDDTYTFEEYWTDIRVIHTPGHTLCSISAIDKNGNVFVGDSAMGFPIRIVPRLPIIAADFNLLITSWKKIIGEGAKKVYPAHGKPFKIDKIRKKVERKK